MVQTHFEFQSEAGGVLAVTQPVALTLLPPFFNCYQKSATSFYYSTYGFKYICNKA